MQHLPSKPSRKCFCFFQGKQKTWTLVSHHQTKEFQAFSCSSVILRSLCWDCTNLLTLHLVPTKEKGKCKLSKLRPKAPFL